MVSYLYNFNFISHFIYQPSKLLHFKLISECGVRYVEPNIKIIGGVVSNAYSWPAHALVIQTYKRRYKFPDNKQFDITVQFQCGGTLISQYSILSAAHCKSSQFTYTYSSVTYTIPIEFNTNYPTWESMYKIYVGIQSRSALNTPFQVAEVKIVRLSIQLFLNYYFDITLSIVYLYLFYSNSNFKASKFRFQHS